MTVLDEIKKNQDAFTTAEQKIATYILEEYPNRGIDTLQNLSENIGVSLPSISRFVNKIGFSGYSDFYQALLQELKNNNVSPVDLYHSIKDSMGDSMSFRDSANQAISILSKMTALISENQFERVCDKIADRKRKIYIVGGRISNAIAYLLSMELLQIRNKVYHLPTDSNMWPKYILEMQRQDVCIMIDYRRYQQDLAQLAQKIKTHKKSHIITITNSHNADVCKYATESFITPIDTKTPWDIYCGAIVLTHAIALNVGTRDWDKTSHRINQWDSLNINMPS